MRWISLALLAACTGELADLSPRLSCPDCVDGFWSGQVIPVGAEYGDRIEVVNVGARAAELIAFGPDSAFACVAGCDRPVAPGERRVVSLVFKPMLEGGATAYLDVGRTLRLTGVGVKPKVSCLWEEDLGRSRPGLPVELEVACGNQDAMPLRLHVRPAGSLAAVASEAELLAVPRERVTAKIRVTAPDLRPIAGTLFVMAGAMVIHDAPVRLEVVETVTETDARSLGFATEVGASQATDVWVQNRVDAPITLRADVAGPFKVSPAVVEVPPAQSAQLALVFEPPEIGRHAGTLTIRVDESPGEVSTAELSGVAEPPSLTCTPSGVDFGPSAVPFERSRTLRCHNSAKVKQAVRVEARGDRFRVQSERAFELMPDASAVIDVRFDPVLVGEARGVLYVETPLALRQLPLTANVVTDDACTYAVSPGGELPLPQVIPSSAEISIENVGATRCVIGRARLDVDESSLWLAGEGGVVLEPGEIWTAEVILSGPPPDFPGSLWIEINAGSGLLHLPLRLP